MQELTVNERNLIEQNLGDIDRTIKHLWGKKFRKLCEEVKIGFDDYKSKCYEVICENAHCYNSEKSLFKTFCTTVISRKIATYIIHEKRKKRWSQVYSISLNTTAYDDSGSELIEFVEKNNLTNYEMSAAPLSGEAIEKILSQIPFKRERKVIDYLSRGFSPKDIGEILEIPVESVLSTINSIKNCTEIIKIIRIETEVK